MANITDVFGNAFEDLIDDFTTTVIFKESKDAFAPLKKGYESNNPSDWDNAVAGAIGTLQMGISMYAVGWINSTLLPLLYRRASIIFAYSVSGKVADAMKGVKGKTARVVGKGLGLFLGSTEVRQKNTETAINMMNHQDNMMMQKMKIANHSKRSLDSRITASYSEQQLKAVDLMTIKTKTGTWTSSIEDKKLYQRASGTKFPKGQSWSKFSKKLNSFQEFAKNAEDEVISKAQVEFDTWVANGLKGVK